MTEYEWSVCRDAAPMVAFVEKKATDRKLRLFAVACARLLCDRLRGGDMRETLELGERLADGLASENDRLRGLTNLHDISLNYDSLTGCYWLTRPQEEVSAYNAALLILARFSGSCIFTNRISWKEAARATGEQQPDLLREIFGNPFAPVSVDPQWLTPTVVDLARTIYDLKAFDRMSELADALQSAGCDNEAILNHCRTGGPHVRGCWALDLILGKS